MDLTNVVWRKSSYSGSGDADTSSCVEVAVSSVIAVRDSKAPRSGVLVLSPAEWAALTARLTEV